MSENNNSKNSDSKPSKTADRITVNLELFYGSIITNLKPFFNNSRSAVISHIVKTWIHDHLGEIKTLYGVDVVDVRREFISTKEGETKLEKVGNIVKKIKKIKIDDLAQLVEMNRINLLDLLLENEKELSIFIEGDYISPKDT